MANMDRENMAEDLKKRFDALSDREQRAVDAIMEARDYSIEEALDIVESGDYEFYYRATLADVAYKLVNDHGWFDIEPDTLVKISPYIDYDKLGSDLYADNFCDTSFGIIRFFCP